VKRPRPPELPEPHVVYRALADAWAREAGLDPADVADWLARRRPVSQRTADRMVAAFYPRVSPDAFWIDDELALRAERERSTMRTMRPQAVQEPRLGRPIKNTKHGLAAALRDRRVTLAEEAKAVKRNPTSLRNFMYPKSHPNNRPVPRSLVDYWAKKYGVSDRAWARVDEDT